MKKLVIATRGSALALWQAEHVKSRLAPARPGLEIELLVLKTRGDVILDVPLAKVGGKGLFVKEIEDALLSGKADLAVHSMKDMPMILPEGLILGAVPEREISTDLFLSSSYATLADLPRGSKLGTSSLRRQAQVLALRPDLEVGMLRGNVETRLRKMKEGRFDAIILAGAGMKRLGLSAAHAEELAPPRFIPAVGQGALGVEIRGDRPDVLELVSNLEHVPTRLRVEAERAFLAGLEGGCQVPVGGHAVIRGGEISLEGLVAEPDGRTVLRRALEAKLESDPFAARETACNLGRQLAGDMLGMGAKAILEDLYAKENHGR